MSGVTTIDVIILKVIIGNLLVKSPIHLQEIFKAILNISRI